MALTDTQITLLLGNILNSQANFVRLQTQLDAQLAIQTRQLITNAANVVTLTPAVISASLSDNPTAYADMAAAHAASKARIALSNPTLAATIPDFPSAS